MGFILGVNEWAVYEQPRGGYLNVQKCLRHERDVRVMIHMRGGGLGSRPKKMYWEYMRDGVEYHLMSPTPRR